MHKSKPIAFVTHPTYNPSLLRNNSTLLTTDGPGVGYSLNGILIWIGYYSGIMYAVYHLQHILYCCGITVG